MNKFTAAAEPDVEYQFLVIVGYVIRQTAHVEEEDRGKECTVFRGMYLVPGKYAM